jgi:hypothetical protein
VASCSPPIESTIKAFLSEGWGKLLDGANNRASTSFSEKFLGIFLFYLEQGHEISVLALGN